MKSAASHVKTNGKDADSRSRDTSGGKNAAVLAPPAYGIDFVDGGAQDVAPVQRIGKLQCEEDKKPLQGKFEAAPTRVRELPRRPSLNRTGVPEDLKAGIESLSGMDLSDVRVHTNSDKPAQLNALAYAQGKEIHLAPGQEAHLPHEAWHVVQQRQGRVAPTMQMAGTPVNDDRGLEAEADRMGATAAAIGDRGGTAQRVAARDRNNGTGSAGGVVQLVPTDVTITGVTHFVAPAGASILEGTETQQVTSGDSVRIEPDESLWSRRGPNQEIEKNKRSDSAGLHMYEWFKVLRANSRTVTDNSYLRDETFVSEMPIRDRDVDKGLMVKVKSDGIEDIFAQAHGEGSAAEITAAQKDYQGWLHELMPAKDIMDLHRSVGFEYEFATYCKADGESPGLDAHVELGKSEELSPIFGMPFILETDSNDELEAVTPPLLIADWGGEVNKSAASKIYAIYKASLKSLRDDNMPGPEEDPKYLTTLDFKASGLGAGWEFTEAMEGLCLGKRKKHSASPDNIYSQMNISLTAEEIADFTQTRSQVRNLTFAVVTDANTAIKTIFEAKLGGVFGVYGGEHAMAEDAARMAWQNSSTAITNICKGLAGLVSIPSILAESEGISGESLFSNVKEYCGMWIKDSIPNIVDSSLADAHSRTIMQLLIAASQSEVTAALGDSVDGELSRMKAGVKEWFSWPFKKDSRADTKLAGYKTTFTKELTTTFEAIVERLDEPAPHRVATKGIPAYGGEQFGEEGLGVRKDTFVNIKSGRGRTLHLAEMRNDFVIGQILKGRRKRGA